MRYVGQKCDKWLKCRPLFYTTFTCMSANASGRFTSSVESVPFEKITLEEWKFLPLLAVRTSFFSDQMAISYGRRKEDWGNFRAWWEIGLGKKDSERLFKKCPMSTFFWVIWLNFAKFCYSSAKNWQEALTIPHRGNPKQHLEQAYLNLAQYL